MITGTVSSSELSTKSLRASDYLIDPAKTAKNLVASWLKTSVMGKVTNIRTKPMKHLIEEITHVIRIAYERGQKQKAQEVDNLHRALQEGTNEGIDGTAIANMLLALGRLRGIVGAHDGDDRQNQGFDSIIAAAKEVVEHRDNLKTSLRCAKEDLETLKDDHTDLKEANKRLQDELEEANKKITRLQIVEAEVDELKSLALEMFERADGWHGSQASSHYRSDIHARIHATSAKEEP